MQGGKTEIRLAHTQELPVQLRSLLRRLAIWRSHLAHIQNQQGSIPWPGTTRRSSPTETGRGTGLRNQRVRVRIPPPAQPLR